MKKKLTPWEKRNLGVESSIEFEVEQNELWEDICNELANHRESYQVLHIASGNTDVLTKAGILGFVPIEMNIQLSRKLDAIELPKIYKRFESAISYNIASQDEKEIILQAICEGNIFSTDKVARDPYFGVAHAGRRYACWTQDVLDQGAELLCMKYKGEIVAFDVCIDQDSGILEAFLGGTVPQFKNSGLGFISVYLVTKYAIKKNYKKIITGVSSNNMSILKLHEVFGYHVDNMRYCLIKHVDSEI